MFDTVAAKFDLNNICGLETQHTWLTLLDEVLKARLEQEPANVSAEIWKASLIYAFVLVPCVQSW